MSTGFQVIAPKGYFGMRKALPYVLLRSDPVLEQVTLVSFVDVDKGQRKARTRKAQMVRMPRHHYEAGLVPHRPGAEPGILPVQPHVTLPPWLSDLEDIDFEENPRWTQKGGSSARRKKSPQEEAERRLQLITPALKRIDAILSAENPDLELNRLARQCTPVQNETRYRLWFYSYVAFSYRVWALLPPRTEWGKWDRLDPRYRQSLLGRPGIHVDSAIAGRTDQQMIDRILEGFRRFAGKESRLVDVWAHTVRRIFGGGVVRQPGELPVPYHPQGLPVPTFNRFYYYIRKELGPDVVRREMYGDRTVDYKEGPVFGAMQDVIDNVGARGNFDSTTIKDRPKSYLCDDHLPALHMVDLVDAACRQILGVGFSLGSEQVRAYKLALFCAAIPKSVFGRLIGFPIDDLDWPGYGIPASIFSDRGAGMSAELRKSLGSLEVNFEASPSYDPRANGTAESKHARKKSRLGAPSHTLSDLTVLQMMKREVRRVIAKNRTDYASGRVEDRAVVGTATGSPNELYQHLHDRHRSSLIQVPFKTAVRLFLDEVVFEVQNGRVKFKGREYFSPELTEPALGRLLRNPKDLCIKGYVMQLATKYAWLELNGRLIEVEVKKKDEDEALASLPDLEQIQAMRSRASGRRQIAAQWEVVAAQQEFYDEVGKEASAGRTVKGRPKVSKAALREAAALRSLG